MDIVRQVVVFDAAEIACESAFWASVLGGRVVDDDPAFHCVLDSADQWRVGVQLAPGYVPPGWPDGAPQQVHMDLHVTNPIAAHEEATLLGAVLLRPDDLKSHEGHQVYADPAGHPFCIGWGHPSDEALAGFVPRRFADVQNRFDNTKRSAGSYRRTAPPVLPGPRSTAAIGDPDHRPMPCATLWGAR